MQSVKKEEAAVELICSEQWPVIGRKQTTKLIQMRCASSLLLDAEYLRDAAKAAVPGPDS